MALVAEFLSTARAVGGGGHGVCAHLHGISEVLCSMVWVWDLLSSCIASMLGFMDLLEILLTT